MDKKYKIISLDLQKNLIDFLDEVHFDAVSEGDKDSMHKVNFCNWAINELLNSYDGFLKEKEKDDTKKKSRDQYVDETFMDWNLPEMSEEEYENLVDTFDAFLREWEKEYNKNNPKGKINKREKPKFNRPHLDDVSDYMSLDEIEEYLKDDPELTNYERFDLYYDERERQRKIKEKKKLERGAKPLEQVMKELNIKPSNWKPEDDKDK